MTNKFWRPTAHFRWNRRSDTEVKGFLQRRGIWPAWSDGPRPIGYRLEQKWVTTSLFSHPFTPEEEWRPIPFEDGCMEAVPALDTKDKQFWPVHAE